jgi:hypothetical protein
MKTNAHPHLLHFSNVKLTFPSLQEKKEGCKHLVIQQRAYEPDN